MVVVGRGGARAHTHKGRERERERQTWIVRAKGWLWTTSKGAANAGAIMSKRKALHDDPASMLARARVTCTRGQQD